MQIWIIETSDKSQLWWRKDDGVIPRALSWSKHRPSKKSDNFELLFAKVNIMFLEHLIMVQIITLFTVVVFKAHVYYYSLL